MAAIPTPQGELEVGRRGYQPAATPFSVGKGGARQTPCRQPPWRTQTSHHSGPRLPSPCPKLAPLGGSCFVPLTTKSTLRQPTASNRAACSNPASSFWYRTEQPSPPGLVRLDWRQSLHQTLNVK